MKHDVPTYARLDVLLAKNASRALVLRRGPRGQVATIGWDRSTDSFMLGQWFKGSIDADDCDLSPDGEHFLYQARKKSFEVWTVVSRWPYLKALDFYRDRWGRSGWFLDDHCYVLLNSRPEDQERKQSKLDVKYSDYHSEDPEINPSDKNRLLRNEWMQEKTNRPEYKKPTRFFYKPITSRWTLFQKPPTYGRPTLYPGDAGYQAKYQLHNSFFGEVISCEGWEWADVDEWQQNKGRQKTHLVWAQKGRLFRAQVDDELGLQSIQELYDFNDMKFEEKIAPY